MLLLQVVSKSGIVVKKVVLNAKNNSFDVSPNEIYQIINVETGKVPKGLHASHKGDHLIIDGLPDNTTVTLNNFFSECPAESQCYFATQDSIPALDSIAQYDGMIDADAAASAGIVVPNSIPLASFDDGSILLYGSNINSSALAATHSIGDFLTIGGAALTAAAFASIGGGSSGSAAVSDKILKISGTVTSGPFIAGSTLITAYDKNGNVLGKATVGAGGKYLIEVNSNYLGPVLAVATDSNSTATNYKDEATNNDIDLGSQHLRQISFTVVGSGNINTVVADITPLSEIAVANLGVTNSNIFLNISAADIAAIDSKLAKLFNINGINVQPIAINSIEYNETDGLSDGEKLGRVLAALSGSDNVVGGSLSNTLSLLSNGISFAGSSVSITQNAFDLLSEGINILETGVNGALTVKDITLASLLNVPIIDTAKNGISAGEINSTNLTISAKGGIAGDVITVHWGNQTFTHLLSASEVSSGVANIHVPATIIQNAGSGNVLVNTVIGNLAPSGNFLVNVSLTTPVAPAAPTAAFDNVGLVQGNVLSGGASDDSTLSLLIVDPAIGQVAVLYVDGVEVTSVYVPTVGLLPATLTPVTGLLAGAHNLSYAYRDPVANTTGFPSPNFSVTITAPVAPAVPTAAIDNVGLVQGNVLSGGASDDSTLSLLIVDPAIGQVAVLYVDGVEVTSVYVPTVGLLPATLTPIGDLDNGLYHLSYAYRDSLTSNTSLQSTALDLTIFPASTVNISNIGISTGTLANDVFNLNTPSPISGLTINTLLNSNITLVAGGLGIDQLAVTGTNQTLDLTAINDLNITSIEKIDLTGTGNNTLKLNLSDILAINPTVNVFNNTNGFATGTYDLGATVARSQLIVDGNAGDTLNTNGALASLSNVGNVTHQGVLYDVYHNATTIELLVNKNLTVI